MYSHSLRLTQVCFERVRKVTLMAFSLSLSLSLSLSDGCVTLEEFESTTEGIIQFLVKCFQGNNNEALETLWEQDKDHWP